MDKRIFLVGVASLAVVGLAVFLTFLFAKPVSFRGTAYGQPYPPAPEFELIRSNGETFRLNDQRDKIILLFFGYTSCPDVCPTTLAELNAALFEIGEKADSVQVVLVSVDPQRDSPQKIQEYVERFNSSFIGLSGSADELETIWQDYGVFREIVQEDSAMGYIVNHTARTILIDTNGSLRLSYGFETPVEDIVNDLDILLK